VSQATRVSAEPLRDQAQTMHMAEEPFGVTETAHRAAQLEHSVELLAAE